MTEGDSVDMPKTQQSDKEKFGVTKEMRETYERIMRRRLSSPTFHYRVDENGEEVKVYHRDRSTNWNDSNEGTVRRKQPYMMGEGLGNNLGIDKPKYTYSERVEEVDEEERDFQRKVRRLKTQLTRRKNKVRVESQKKAEEDGRWMTGQRIFALKRTYDQNLNHGRDFETRSKRLKIQIPDGVDVAQTEFGMLLIIPVIEAEEGWSKGLGNPKKDPYGRNFWVSTEVKEAVQNLFGYVNWERPLTIPEAEQFGVKVL